MGNQHHLETATEEPSHDAPDEATRAYASATPLVTAALPVAPMPVPHVKREAATRPAKVRGVETKARQAHSVASGADRLVQGSFRATQRGRCLSRIRSGPLNHRSVLVRAGLACWELRNSSRNSCFNRQGLGIREVVSGVPIIAYTTSSHVLPRWVKLTTRHLNTGTSGFAAPEDANTAVCVVPGTELAFARAVTCRPRRLFAWKPRVIDHTTAIFPANQQGQPANAS